MIKDRGTPLPPHGTLPQFCYQMAYYILPKLLFENPKPMLMCFTLSEVLIGAYLYMLSCAATNHQERPDDVKAFRGYSGELMPGKKYYILQYPTPAPVPTPIQLGAPGIVLAPFFTAFIETQETGDVSYYTLGQAPLGGTTVRRVMPEGINANLGPGPEPELEAFLEALRERINGRAQ